FCPECADQFDEPQAVDRRHFIRVVGGAAATALVAGGAVVATPTLAAAQTALPTTRTPRPAEALVHALHAPLTGSQPNRVLLPWNRPSRKRMFNTPMNVRIADVYTRPQQELLQRIMRAISSGEEGYRRLARNGTWDTRGGFGGCGANFFGEVAEG